MLFQLVSTVLFSLGLLLASAPTADKAADKPAAQDCCAKELACCAKGKACCDAQKKLACCEQECCRQGGKCCADAKGCCGASAKEAKAQEAKGCCGGGKCCCAVK